MSLANFSQKELKQNSMLKLASIILRDEKKAMDFQELFEQISDIKGFTKEEKEEKIAQFYTELNVDGRFLTIGSNIWGLKEWYPVEQAEEKVTSIPKKRKSKKQDDVEEEDLEYEEDLIELGDEEEEDLDEIDEFDEVFDEDEEEGLEVDIDLEDEDEKI